MHKVSPRLRNLEKNDKIYDPLVVSFGPYHHGKPELQDTESYKSISVQLFVSESGKSLEFFKNKILEIIDDVRSCYVAGSTSSFSDSELAEMMLKDASFLLNYIEHTTGSDQRRIYKSTVNNLDRLSFTLIVRDLFLLENQIPYSVLTLLIYLRYEQSEPEEMLVKFISETIFGEKRKRKKLSVYQQQPAHLLDALRQVLVPDINIQQSNSCISFLCKGKDKNISCYNDAKFRSSTDLARKKIRLKRTKSYSLKGINFKSFCFHSELQIPRIFVSIYTKVIFSNMIAYENCLEAGTLPVVTAYVSFMKVLIQNVEDVKLLRERKIIVNHLVSDEEALQVFNNLDKFALGMHDEVFKEVRNKIHQHCNSKAQTWKTKLIHSYLRRPLQTLTFIVAIILLCLGIVEAYDIVKSR